jgi:predicted transcriptional regulator
LASYLPPQVEQLARRERQIASAVYARGAMTAKEIEAELARSISNGAIRSMLSRLVGKGILVRRWGSRGRGQQFIYLPAITDQSVRNKALQIVADQYFDGSLLRAFVALFELLESDRGDAASSATVDAEARAFYLARLAPDSARAASARG